MKKSCQRINRNQHILWHLLYTCLLHFILTMIHLEVVFNCNLLWERIVMKLEWKHTVKFLRLCKLLIELLYKKLCFVLFLVSETCPFQALLSNCQFKSMQMFVFYSNRGTGKVFQRKITLWTSSAKAEYQLKTRALANYNTLVFQ